MREVIREKLSQMKEKGAFYSDGPTVVMLKCQNGGYCKIKVTQEKGRVCAVLRRGFLARKYVFDYSEL